MNNKNLMRNLKIQRYTYNPKYILHGSLALTTVVLVLAYIGLRTGNTIAGGLLVLAAIVFLRNGIKYGRYAQRKVERRAAYMDFENSYSHFYKHRLAQYEWGSPKWFEQLQPFAKVAKEQGPVWTEMLRRECQDAKTHYLLNHQ